MDRKEFLKIAGIGTAGVAFLPFINGSTLMAGIHEQEKKRLAEIALSVAKNAGASYADIRIGRYLNQFISSREQNVSGITNTESYGFGIRVIANGTWGFASSNQMDENEIKRV